MKYCPSCQTQYTDETLKFCLQDGTPLAEYFAAPVTPVEADEEQTVISNRKEKLWNDMQVSPPQPKILPPPPVQREVRTASKTPWVILTAVLTTLLVAAGVGAWLYSRNPSGETAESNNTPNMERRTAANSVLKAPASPIPAASPAANTNREDAISESGTPDPLTPPADREQAKEEVSKRIYDWTTLTESGEIDELMSNYSDRVDYYRRPGASAEFIRNDKLRAFSEFDSIKFEIDNMNVVVDKSGDTATAVFDKSWNFEGQTRSEGKVQQQMKLKKIDGIWLITGERDLKLYNKR